MSNPYIYIYTSTYIYIDICIYISRYVDMYIYIYTYTYTYVYAHIHIRLHTNTCYPPARRAPLPARTNYTLTAKDPEQRGLDYTLGVYTLGGLHSPSTDLGLTSLPYFVS